MSTVGTHRIVHGLLTAMLALGYAAVVIYLAGLLSIVGRGSGLAVAIATLVVAALLWPAWRRLQAALDRRFSRHPVGAGRHR
jgi:hypothetical protein